MLRSVLSGVWQVDLPWTNAWILAKDGDVVLIDSGTRWDRAAVVRGLKKACPGGFRLRSVLLTHGHCDHAGNAAFLAERYGAKVYCGVEERPFLATRRTYIPPGIRAVSLSGLLFAAGEVVFPVKRRAPEVAVRQGDLVDTPLGPLSVIETPGHTPGHVSYFHGGEGWLFSGDALINVIPWIRKTGLSLPIKVFSWDVRLGAESAWKIAGLNPSAMYPGHGPPLRQDTAATICRFLEQNAPRTGTAGVGRDDRQ
jgi:glyoxylase-like metal-dependent hydrolase (beta-lactamase superfamily II)